MFLRFTVVWLSCPKLFEVCWSYITSSENSCMRAAWLRGNFLFCLSGCVFKLNSPSVDSSRAFHEKHAFSKRKCFLKLQTFSWSYRLFFFLNFLNFLTSLPNSCVSWPGAMFMFVGEPSFATLMMFQLSFTMQHFGFQGKGNVRFPMQYISLIYIIIR